MTGRAGARAVSGALGDAGDTIAAIATAPGRGAIAVIRVSGARAHEIVARLATPWPPPPRVATLCALRDPVTATLLDRGLVTTFADGHSYTGEASVEIGTHGGAWVPAAVLGALIAAGAREATPGEFTRRALLNGRIDLVQAEAIADLIEARTSAMQRQALAQLDGGLSARVGELRLRILDIEALLAYDIDFPEEDDGPVPRARISAACASVRRDVEALLATGVAGELVREGAVVAIVGAPNVGKSSLFNALLGRARAIVTDRPGTTRDALEAVIDGGRWPLRLVDTAGLREPLDPVEQLGIEMSERYLAAAHVVLACAEREEQLAPAVDRARAHSRAPVIAVRTKCDLDAPWNASAGASAVVSVSAVRGTGLRELLACVEVALDEEIAPPPPGMPLLTRARHRRALEEAREELEAFGRAWTAGAAPAPVAAVHVRAAARALEDVIGAVDAEDVLGRLFSAFCVGK